MSTRRTLAITGLVLAPLLMLALAVGGMLLLRQGGLEPYRVPTGPGTPPTAATPEQLAQGEYVAQIGDCVSCHSVRGGEPFAGGRAFKTDWGTIYSTNLTPDPETGLGNWSLEEFRHTMRHGVSRHGVLYPVFPYAHFALASDADLDALFAWLRQLPATAHEVTPNKLEFPASWRPAQVVWRMLHYRPPNPDFGASQPEPWRRGRYLVDGLGHCAMCHGQRGTMGSLPLQGYLAGGRIPGVNWYAPPLDGRQLQRYSAPELADYLRSGTSPHGTAYGPMAEVVYRSLRHLTADDALAMATFLKTVPPHPVRRPPTILSPKVATRGGAALYKQYCEDCHASDGRGKDSKYPPLADSVAITAPDAVNAVRLILYGAMAPTTAANPRPYSMPPFVQQLDSSQIAALTNYIRATWGGQPPSVSATDVESLHGIVTD